MSVTLPVCVCVSLPSAWCVWSCLCVYVCLYLQPGVCGLACVCMCVFTFSLVWFELLHQFLVHLHHSISLLFITELQHKPPADWLSSRLVSLYQHQVLNQHTHNIVDQYTPLAHRHIVDKYRPLAHRPHTHTVDKYRPPAHRPHTHMVNKYKPSAETTHTYAHMHIYRIYLSHMVDKYKILADNEPNTAKIQPTFSRSFFSLSLRSASILPAALVCSSSWPRSRRISCRPLAIAESRSPG